MDQVPILLANLCEDVEAQLKPRLRDSMADIVREYLPQVWVFETEYGSCTVYIDTDGFARVHPGADRLRDVTIVWNRKALEAVLTSRNRNQVEPGDYPDVVVHTSKGRAAFNYLKKEIGL